MTSVLRPVVHLKNTNPWEQFDYWCYHDSIDYGTGFSAVRVEDGITTNSNAEWLDETVANARSHHGDESDRVPGFDRY